ncbi:MAG: hypothetical protein AB9836_04360 [Aminipila sp.]
MENVITKSVSFNTDDEYQKELYDYAKTKKYFSTYVKRLIYDDIKRNEQKELKSESIFNFNNLV